MFAIATAEPSLNFTMATLVKGLLTQYQLFIVTDFATYLLPSSKLKVLPFS